MSVLIISPAGAPALQLPTDNIPIVVRTAAQVSRGDWYSSAAVVVDDRCTTQLLDRGLPKRPYVIVLATGQDDATLWDRAVELGAAEVVTLPNGNDWLQLRLHNATCCRFVDWNRLLNDGPGDGAALGV